MTREEYTKLSDDEKCIKIAGHANCEFRQEEMSGVGVRAVWITTSGERFMQKPPDYLNDLNAMHEAEKVLLGSDILFRVEYVENLMDVVARDLPEPIDSGAYLYHATAAQKAEAFVLTMEGAE